MLTPTRALTTSVFAGWERELSRVRESVREERGGKSLIVQLHVWMGVCVCVCRVSK